MAVTQDELYAALDLELSWSERSLPVHVRTQHEDRFPTQHGQVIQYVNELSVRWRLDFRDKT